MIKRLFDASSIILLAKRNPEKASTILEGQYRLDLTIYEVGNAVWKVNKLINKTGKSTALDAVEEAYYLTVLMEVIRIGQVEELKSTMEIAFDRSLSFYDSAYLYAARKNGLTLVTEDERLRRLALELRLNSDKIGDLEVEP
jgi:predicted nucleic acid-binding protein